MADPRNNTRIKTTSAGPSSSSVAKKNATAGASATAAGKTGAAGTTAGKAATAAKKTATAKTSAATKASPAAKKNATAKISAAKKAAATKATGQITGKADSSRTAADSRKQPSAMKKRRKNDSKKTSKKQFLIGWRTVTIISSAAIALLLVPFLLRKSGETGAVVPQGITGKFALDISHHNGDRIRWDSLFVMTDLKGRTTRSRSAAADITRISYVFIKATEGERMTDKNFAANWKHARESQVKRGAYHFFRSSKSPAAQAENFIRTVGTLDYRDLPPVLDIETMHKGCDKKTLSGRALEWLRIVERHYGVKPIVYTSDSYARDILSKEITSNYPLWIAHYGVPSPITEDWTMWQFTDEAVIAGVRGKADLSICRNSP